MHTLTKVAAVAAIGAAVLTGCSWQNKTEYTDCVINAKDMLYSGSQGDTTRTKRLTTSCGSFDVEDSIAGGFNSWDTWQALEVGKAYDIRSGGYRVGFFSMFPVVLEIKPAAQ